MNISTTKQSEKAIYNKVRAKPFTRIYYRPTHRDYKNQKQECTNLALDQEFTYEWSAEYGIMSDIVGAEEYKALTQVQTFQVSQEPDIYTKQSTTIMKLMNKK